MGGVKYALVLMACAMLGEKNASGSVAEKSRAERET
jgi:hypothetical protein